jgi:hypothetical protein
VGLSSVGHEILGFCRLEGGLSNDVKHLLIAKRTKEPRTTERSWWCMVAHLVVSGARIQEGCRVVMGEVYGW